MKMLFLWTSALKGGNIGMIKTDRAEYGADELVLCGLGMRETQKW